ncbi:hypothetical protein REPUB_Repub20aG0008400 [Reevesia pubescens]
MPARFEQTIWIVMSLMLRKSVSMFQELSCLLMDLASVLMSAIRFSSLVARHHQPSANQYRRYHPMSSSMDIPT